MSGEYDTRYDGGLSEFLNVTVAGTPRSGRITAIDYTYTPPRYLGGESIIVPQGMWSHAAGKRIDVSGMYMRDYLAENRSLIDEVEGWKNAIRKAISTELVKLSEGGMSYPSIPSHVTADTNCYLKIIFWLFNKKRKQINRYEDADLDNLLKPVLDALYNNTQDEGLVVDDKLFKGIKVLKEPVIDETHEGVSIECVTTKTFTVITVEEVPGDSLMPGYWKYPMQYITAVDSQRKTGYFIDNPPGALVTTSGRDIPGYPWKTGEVSGCVVLMTEHPDNKKMHWLKKWAWGE